MRNSNFIRTLALSSLIAAASNASGTSRQTAAQSEHVSNHGEAPAQAVVLKDGTDVKLRFAQELSSKTAFEGDPVDLVLDEDLRIGDVVVARTGAKAVGTVTNAKKAGMLGKAGELNIRLEYLKIGDVRIRLRGAKGKEGDSATGTAIALTVLLGPVGVIKHGKDIILKEGTPMAAFTDGDISLPAIKQDK